MCVIIWFACGNTKAPSNRFIVQQPRHFYGNHGTLKMVKSSTFNYFHYIVQIQYNLLIWLEQSIKKP